MIIERMETSPLWSKSRIFAAHKFFWEESPYYMGHVGGPTRFEYVRAYVRFMAFTFWDELRLFVVRIARKNQ